MQTPEGDEACAESSLCNLCACCLFNNSRDTTKYTRDSRALPKPMQKPMEDLVDAFSYLGPQDLRFSEKTSADVALDADYALPTAEHGGATRYMCTANGGQDGKSF